MVEPRRNEFIKETGENKLPVFNEQAPEYHRNELHKEHLAQVKDIDNDHSVYMQICIRYNT
jgi:hypothetical protein